MAMAQQPQVLILDLGNVVFEWLTESGSESKQFLRRVLMSDLYSQYERGMIQTEMDFCEALSAEEDIPATEIARALGIARRSLQVNKQLLDFIVELKRKSSLSVYAMTNIPRSDIDYLHDTFPQHMAVFNHVFASGYMGLSKPDPAFYHVVAERISSVPDAVVFVDDKARNVDGAQQMGWHGVKYHDNEQLCNILSALIVPK